MIAAAPAPGREGARVSAIHDGRGVPARHQQAAARFPAGSCPRRSRPAEIRTLRAGAEHLRPPPSTAASAPPQDSDIPGAVVRGPARSGRRRRRARPLRGAITQRQRAPPRRPSVISAAMRETHESLVRVRYGRALRRPRPAAGGRGRYPSSSRVQDRPRRGAAADHQHPRSVRQELEEGSVCSVRTKAASAARRRPQRRVEQPHDNRRQRSAGSRKSASASAPPRARRRTWCETAGRRSGRCHGATAGTCRRPRVCESSARFS